MLTNMDPPPAEGNFCDDNNCPVKPHVVARYNRHMGYVDNSDRMANSYSMSQRNFKWTMKLFFHLLNLTVLSSWILLSSCGAKYGHRDFRLLLVRNLIEEAGRSQNRRPPPQFYWKDKCGCNKCNETRRPPTLASKIQHTPLPCLLSVRCEKREQSTSARNVMSACAWCLVSRTITLKLTCKTPKFCIVIQGDTDRLQ
jgi:hypothetical protein